MNLAALGRRQKNKYILNRIIECVKVCGAYELALRGHEKISGTG
jgi:hypothetical protein